MRLKQRGDAAVELLVWGCSWCGAKPDPQLGPAARLSAIGNEFYGSAPPVDPVTERTFFEESPAEAALVKLSHALDDLRRLGEADLRLRSPTPSP